MSKENRPAARIVIAEKLAEIASARGVDLEVYGRALELIAVEFYRDEVLTLGQAAKLAGLPLSDFIDLCGKLRVPVLWAPKEGLAAEVDAAANLLESDSYRNGANRPRPPAPGPLSHPALDQP